MAQPSRPLLLELKCFTKVLRSLIINPAAHPSRHSHQSIIELDRAEAGDNAGLLLRGLKREQLRRGQVIVRPGTITAHKSFLAQMYILTKDEGGRHTPFVENYGPQLFSRTMDVACTMVWPDNEQGLANRNEGKMVMPGDNVEMLIKLQHAVAIDEGLRFTVREGGKTVGTGVVTKLLQ